MASVKIHPKLLNSIFKHLTSQTAFNNRDQENHTLMAEEIIEISPSYNPDKKNAKRKKK